MGGGKLSISFNCNYPPSRGVEKQKGKKMKIKVMEIIQSSYDKDFEDIVVMGVRNGDVYLSVSMEMPEELLNRICDIVKSITRMYKKEVVSLSIKDINKVVSDSIKYRNNHVEINGKTLGEWYGNNDT